MAVVRVRSIRRQYFAIFFLAAVLPVLLTGAAAILTVQEALATRTAQDNELLAQSIATVVENRITDIAGAAEDAAGTQELQDAIASGANRSVLEGILLTIGPAQRTFEAMGVVGRDGAVAARWPASADWMLGRNLSDETFLAVHITPDGTFQTSMPTFVGGVFTYAGPPGTFGPYITVSTAIRDDVETEQGIFIALVPAGSFASAVPPLQALDLTALLFDGQGKLITSRVSAGMEAHITNLDSVARDLAQSSGASGSARTAAPDPQVMAYAPARSGTALWAVVLRLPLSAVYAEASSVLVFTTGIVVAAALFAALLAAFLSARTVGPIVSLTQATKDLSRAQELPPAMTDRGDEIGMLSRSFAEMAAAVKAESEANRKLIARLEELERLKSALIDTVSHELRTPITIIRGNAELLTLDKASAGPKTERASNRIVEACEQLAYLVEELIELGQLQSRQTTVRLAPVDVNVLVEDVRGLEADHMRRSGVAIDLELAPGLAAIEGDGPKLRIAVRNLVSNAVKFSPRDSRVVVTTLPARDGVELRVKDSGPGIKAEEVPHIFDVFYQGTTSLTRAHGGAGIGLALVRQFVDLHQGLVVVETAEGKGSTFVMWLPTAQTANAGDPL